jgi:hypothetical protein
MHALLLHRQLSMRIPSQLDRSRFPSKHTFAIYSHAQFLGPPILSLEGAQCGSIEADQYRETPYALATLRLQCYHEQEQKPDVERKSSPSLLVLPDQAQHGPFVQHCSCVRPESRLPAPVVHKASLERCKGETLEQDHTGPQDRSPGDV